MTNNFQQWVDRSNRRTCLKISQQYYISKESGTKFSWFRKRLIILLIRRLFFILLELLLSNRAPVRKNQQQSKNFVKRLLGLYKFERYDLLPGDPVLTPLNFKEEQNPMVSIVIAVHNHLDYTYNCLQSILLNTDDVKYEIILINDCSSDNTAKFMNNISNLIYLENDENLGFLKSCNKAAKCARGEYICLLNNDTQVTPTWLLNLVSIFNTDTGTGLVGAKLIYPYGLLQEAGGIVNYLGQPANYGKYNDPKLDKFNYLRQADYCSGACILVLKKDFEQLGGFDENFAPAYYEDTDLCFAIRYQLNKKVYYQPQSEIIHYEGISSGKIMVPGSIKEYQRINADKFTTKWASVLLSFPKTLVYEEIANKFSRS